MRLAALNGYKALIFPICPFCGKETAPTEICYEWNTDAVTAQTGCFNEECPGCKGKMRFLVRIRPEDEEKAVGDFLGKENLFFKGIKAAKKAELPTVVTPGVTRTSSTPSRMIRQSPWGLSGRSVMGPVPEMVRSRRERL